MHLQFHTSPHIPSAAYALNLWCRHINNDNNNNSNNNQHHNTSTADAVDVAPCVWFGCDDMGLEFGIYRHVWKVYSI